MSEAKYIPELERWFVQHLTEKALDALYDSLSVQTMPEGRYDGRAWIYGHPVLGWLASFVWRGKTFYRKRTSWDLFVRNRVFGLPLFRGRTWAEAETEGATGPYGRQFRIEYSWWLGLPSGLPSIYSAMRSDYREFVLTCPWVPLTDYVRQVSPTLYLGRMQWRRWTVHFTLVKP